MLLGKLKKIVKRVIRPEPKELTVAWVRESKESWLRGWLSERSVAPPLNPRSRLIERLADATDDLGPKRIWEHYADDSRGRWRQPDAVRTDRLMGNIFSALVVAKQPNIVVEFGTAFGVSGMYWLAGLEEIARGTLYTFDPNEEWAQIARKNLESIGNRFVQVVGTFEDHVDRTLPPNAPIEIAFIDAIHTSEFVERQLDIVISRSRPGTLIICDDIAFSDDMRGCWDRIANSTRFVASATIGSRVGIVELGSGSIGGRSEAS